MNKVFQKKKIFLLLLLLLWGTSPAWTVADDAIIVSSPDEIGIEISIETEGDYYISESSERINYYAPAGASLVMKAPDDMQISLDGTDFDDSFSFDSSISDFCAEIYVKTYSDTADNGDGIDDSDLNGSTESYEVTKYKVTCPHNFIIDDDAPEAEWTIEGVYTAWGEYYISGSFIEIRIDAKDELSGLGSAALYFGDDVACEIEKPNAEDGYVFNTEIADNSLPMHIEISDRVGNVIIIEPEIGKVHMDDKSPEITVSRENDDGYRKDDVIYSRKPEKITVQISKDRENSCPLRFCEIEVNGGVIAESDYCSYEEMCYQDTFSVQIFSEQDDDGLYSVVITAIDCAGNESVSRVDFYKDTEAPKIISYELSGTDAENKSDILYGENRLTTDDAEEYGCFAAKDVRVYIKAKDKEDASGLKHISYRLYENGKTIQQKDIDFNEKGEASFVIESDFKGRLYIEVYDKVGNVSEEYTNNDLLIVMSSNRFDDEEHIKLDIPDSQYTDRENCALYRGDGDIALRVFDTYAGIHDVKWQLLCNGAVIESGLVKIGRDGVVTGDKEWESESREENLLKEIGCHIPIDIEGNSLNLNVEMTNQVGYHESETIQFSVDKTAPIVTMEMVTETGLGIYYETDCKVKVSVKDKNFDPDLVTVNGAEDAVWIDDWNDEGDDCYVRNLVFRNEGPYLLSATAVDRAGNKSETFDMEKFVIDKNAPVTTVVLEGSDSRNECYYNVPVTAVITVSEKNFSAELYQVTLIENQVASLVAGDWKFENGLYVMRIPFSKDGRYSLMVSGEDEAGNKSEDADIPLFIIDTESPGINVDGIENMSAYNGDIEARIILSDENYDKKTLQIELEGARRGVQELEYTLYDTAEGQMIILNNPEKERQNDDLYTLNVCVSDKAGNKSENIIQYSVNRFGSVYTLGDDTVRINGSFINDCPSICITETNVNRIEHDTAEIILSRDGTPAALKENRDYTVSEISDENGWKQYKYILDDKLFKRDGVYTVALYTIDAAGNRNGTLLHGNEEELRFGIDRTSPVIQLLNINSHGTYNDSSRLTAVMVRDNLKLSDVSIYLNDEVVEYTLDGDIYSFYIKEDETTQRLRIIAYDEAGNECAKEVDDIMISTTPKTRWNHRMRNALMILAGVSGVIILALLIRHRLFCRSR